MDNLSALFIYILNCDADLEHVSCFFIVAMVQIVHLHRKRAQAKKEIYGEWGIDVILHVVCVILMLPLKLLL